VLILSVRRFLCSVVTSSLGLLASTLAHSATAISTDLSRAARAILGESQGVYIETTDGTVLLAQAAQLPVHPASVSKVPTTLALLRKLGPEHRFVTTFSSNGRIVDGTLYGDLSVANDGDPSLVDEDALLIAERLKQSGVRAISGELLARTPLTFDWSPDDALPRLRRALAGQTPPAAWTAVREVEVANGIEPGSEALAQPGIRFTARLQPPTPAAGSAAKVVQLQEDQPLVSYQSQPLLPLVKSLNDFSNNIIKPFAAAAGGAAAVESLARSAVPDDMRSEITLGDGAGTDPANRLSPRAAVKLLRALEAELARSGHALYDILPVAGVDTGTLHDRLNGPEESGRVVGKTGTFGDYGASALIGAIRTTDRGTVYFAILNHGVPVPQARKRQDQFVTELLAHLDSVPWSYVRDARPAVARAQVVVPPR
jgi:D-alanyl-D-alanine carboxypeptidase/D-alanyl-D-alanine-endopeptidase (penicillin-binding protein 4)